jgi:hypothetical protein
MPYSTEGLLMDRNLLSILVFGTIAVCVAALFYLLFKDSAKPSATAGKDRKRARQASKIEAKDKTLRDQKLQQAAKPKGPSKEEAFSKTKQAREKHEAQKEEEKKRRQEEEELRLRRLEHQKQERLLEQKEHRKEQKRRSRQNQVDHANLLLLQEQLEKQEDERVEPHDPRIPLATSPALFTHTCTHCCNMQRGLEEEKNMKEKRMQQELADAESWTPQEHKVHTQ